MPVFRIDNKDYDVTVIRNRNSDADAVRIIIPVFMPNETAFEISRVCVESVRKFTVEPHEIWVVDNCSPAEFSGKITKIEGVNFLLNATEPMPPSARGMKFKNFLNVIKRPSGPGGQVRHGSYANGVGLELASGCIDVDTRFVFTMHSDCLVTKKGWLTYLKSKLDNKTRAVGCCRDRLRVGALHIAGLLFDFGLFKSLGMDFLPNIRQERTRAYPEYDVGDLISIKLKENGFDSFVCANTYNHPELISGIADDTVRQLAFVDRSLDDAGDVFFLHLGRGISKSVGSYKRGGRIYPQQWFKLAYTYIK